MSAAPGSRFTLAALCVLCIGAPAAYAQESAPEPETKPKQESPQEPKTLPKPGTGAYIAGAPSEMSADEVAKKLANPNAPLASLTLKSQWTRWDGSLPGAGGLDSQTFLFQPSFPFPVNETDLVFLRPAIPYLVDQPVVDASGNVHTRSGFGDMGLDLSYGRTTKTGSILAAGMVAGLPIGADGLSSDTWKLGPELVVGRLRESSVVLLFANHQWDVSGPAETSLTTIQPILSYLPGGGWSISTAGLITYNWVAEQWTVPLNLTVSRTLKLGKLPLKLQLEGNYYVERDDSLGPKWMIGFNMTPVVPNVVAGWLGRK